ncbi:MAG TPA: hypothetical protein VHT75_03265 [Acidimicrobiales bacterium]|jgi:hypothetical protein|nr:hypothetical protein [Acidimicrobiales bacterium]
MEASVGPSLGSGGSGTASGSGRPNDRVAAVAGGGGGGEPGPDAGAPARVAAGVAGGHDGAVDGAAVVAGLRPKRRAGHSAALGGPPATLALGAVAAPLWAKTGGVVSTSGPLDGPVVAARRPRFIR